MHNVARQRVLRRNLAVAVTVKLFNSRSSLLKFDDDVFVTYLREYRPAVTFKGENLGKIQSLETLLAGGHRSFTLPSAH